MCHSKPYLNGYIFRGSNSAILFSLFTAKDWLGAIKNPVILHNKFQSNMPSGSQIQLVALEKSIKFLLILETVAILDP